MGDKICTKCGDSKHINEYPVRKSAKDGHRNECKVCTNKYAAENSYKYADKKKQTEKSRIVMNREHINAKRREWKRRNRDKCNTERRKWVEHNPDRVKHYNRTQKHKRRASGCSLRTKDIDKVLLDAFGHCAYCGKEFDGSFHIDHITPVKHGGTSQLDNLIAACPKCNLSKGVKTVVVFLAERRITNDL